MEKEFKEILVAELVALTGGLFAGSVLSVFMNRLELIPAMFVLIPGFLEMKGGVGGSLSARLGSALHKGTLKSKNPDKRYLFSEVLVSVCLLVCTSFVLGILTFLFSGVLLGRFLVRVIFVPVIAVLISGFFETSIFIYSSVYLYRKGHDPDNIMGPYVTTIGDITSIISLVVASVLIL